MWILKMENSIETSKIIFSWTIWFRNFEKLSLPFAFKQIFSFSLSHSCGTQLLVVLVGWIGIFDGLLWMFQRMQNGKDLKCLSNVLVCSFCCLQWVTLQQMKFDGLRLWAQWSTFERHSSKVYLFNVSHISTLPEVNSAPGRLSAPWNKTLKTF